MLVVTAKVINSVPCQADMRQHNYTNTTSAAPGVKLR